MRYPVVNTGIRRSMGQTPGLESLAAKIREIEQYLSEYCSGPEPVFDCDAVSQRRDRLLGAYLELQRSGKLTTSSPFGRTGQMVPSVDEGGYANHVADFKSMLNNVSQQGLTPSLTTPQAQVTPGMVSQQPYQSYSNVPMTPVSPEKPRRFSTIPMQESIATLPPIGPVGTMPQGPLPPPQPTPPPSAPQPKPLAPFVPSVDTGGASGYEPVGPLGPPQRTPTEIVGPEAPMGPLSETGECIPPSIPDGKGGCIPGVDTGYGGGGGNLFSSAMNLGPSGGGATAFGMGRILTRPLMRARF